MSGEQERCPDCGLSVAPARKTRNARVDLMSCGARFSAHYELHCKRVAVARLHSELADWELVKGDPVVQGRLAVIKLAAQRKEQSR